MKTSPIKQMALTALLVTSTTVAFSQTKTLRFEAEKSSEAKGVIAKDLGKETVIKGFSNGSWIKFSDVNFNEMSKINFRASSAAPDAVLEIRLDNSTGPLIGTVQIVPKSWAVFKETSTKLLKVAGKKDMVIVAVAGGVILDWFELSAP